MDKVLGSVKSIGDFITSHEHGVYTIDACHIRPGLVASHLLIEQGQAVFIDVGPATSLAILLAALEYLNVSTTKVVAVIVTHVHLDHAGCAGVLLDHLPNAKLLVHPRGARHMIDPTQLIAGATSVYGEADMLNLFGEIKPVEASRVIEVDEVFRFRLGCKENIRELKFIYTPGHAKHHYCVFDCLSRGIFTGDSFGLSYREFDTDKGPFILPTTTPVQFDPQASHESIEKLIRLEPVCMYLTHFGKIENPVMLAIVLHRQIDLLVEQAKAVVRFESRSRFNALKQQLLHLLTAQLYEHGCSLSDEKIKYLMEMDIELNTQGLLCWLDKIETRQH